MAWYWPFNKKADAALEEVMERAEIAENNYELIEGQLADLIFKLEDVGWKPLGYDEDLDSVPRETIVKLAQVTRALACINPLVARAIAVRTAYIWGNGVEFDGADKYKDFFEKPTVQKWLCSDKAWQEMEKAGNTDGNFFVLATKAKDGKSHDIKRLPFKQVVQAVTNPDNDEEVWLYRVEWERKQTDANGVTSSVTQKVYYPAIDFDEKKYGRPRSFSGIRVDWDSRVAHHSPNKQLGWKWGVPSLWAAMFWAKAHKEYLETQLSLVKAYARFAFKVTANNANQVKSAATKMSTVPGIDPMTGQPNAVGAAFAGAGVNLQSVGKPAGATDFEAGKPLANYVAAALSVPLGELLADASDANRASAETAQSTTMKVMKAEQNTYRLFFESIFRWLGMDVTVKFPAINKGEAFRLIQAYAQASSLHLLSDEQLRKLLLEAFDIETDEGLPTEEDQKLQLIDLNGTAEMQKQQAKLQADAAKAQVGAGAAGGVPGSKSKAGTQRGSNKNPETATASYGDNSKRSAIGQHAYSAGRNG